MTHKRLGHHIKGLAFALVLSLGLSACANGSMSGEDGKRYGQIIGGILGAAIGAEMGEGNGKILATALGGVVGVWLGGELGEALAEGDLIRHGETQEEALNSPTGETKTWSNPDSGASGEAVATSDPYFDADEEFCREFETTITVDGEAETTTGTACRDSDGSWRVVE